MDFENWQKLAWQCAVLFFILIGIATLALGYEVRTPHTAFSGIKKIEITPGLGSRKIGALLKREGILRSKWAFVTYVSLRNEASDLKPGIYAFDDRAVITKISKELIAGSPEQSVTIPEGWNIKEIAAYLEKSGVAKKDDFKMATGPATLAMFLGQFPFLKERPEHADLEGYLFPDTYRFSIGTPVQQIVLKMLKNFDGKFSHILREEAFRQHHTMYEIVTMASMIEKESATDADRKLISGILWKRLELGIPLQVDATVIFSTKNKTGKISYADISIDSPYNTYKYKSLPKGPIANPGLSAIRAALYPKKSSYLYYLSTSDGSIIFSRTLAEHNRAKAKYIQ